MHQISLPKPCVKTNAHTFGTCNTNSHVEIKILTAMLKSSLCD